MITAKTARIRGRVPATFTRASTAELDNTLLDISAAVPSALSLRSFRVEAETPNAVPGVDIKFVGSGWALYVSSSYSNSAVMYSRTLYDTVTVAVYTSSLTLWFAKSTDCGIITVAVDGAAPAQNATIDTYNNGILFNQSVTWSGLTLGLHTFTFTITGKNVNASATTAYIDCFDIIGSPSTLIDNVGVRNTPLSVIVEPTENSARMDSMGKVAGSTTLNKHKVFHEHLNTLTPALTSFTHEGSQGNYTDYSTLNNTGIYGSVPNSGYYRESVFAWDLSDITSTNADLKLALTQLDVSYFGYGKGQRTVSGGYATNYEAELKIWKATTSAWESLGFCGLAFERSSVAYKQDGTAVLPSTPRYEWGRYHNLATADQASGEVSHTWSDSGAVSSRVTAASESITAYSGSYVCKVVTAGTYTQEGAQQVLTGLTIGKAYIASVYARGTGIIQARAIGIVTGNNVTLSATYQRLYVLFTASATTHAIVFETTINGGTPQSITFYLDGFQLEESLTGQTLPTSFRAGGTGKALMIEEGTTNIPGSLETGGGISVTTGQTDYAGGTSAVLLTAIAADNYHMYRKSLTLTAGLPYTLSVVAKKGTHNRLGFRLDNITSTNDILFDFDTQAFSNTTGYTCVATPLSGGWFRLSVAKASVSGSEPSTGVAMLAAGDFGEYNSLSSGTLYVSHFQCEQKAYPTSYTD